MPAPQKVTSGFCPNLIKLYIWTLRSSRPNSCLWRADLYLDHSLIRFGGGGHISNAAIWLEAVFEHIEKQPTVLFRFLLREVYLKTKQQVHQFVLDDIFPVETCDQSFHELVRNTRWPKVNSILKENLIIGSFSMKFNCITKPGNVLENTCKHTFWNTLANGLETSLEKPAPCFLEQSQQAENNLAQ